MGNTLLAHCVRALDISRNREEEGEELFVGLLVSSCGSSFLRTPRMSACDILYFD